MSNQFPEIELDVSSSSTKYVVPLRGHMFLGRQSSTSTPDVPVNDRFVSRNHGEFILTESGARYRDNGSSNGTLYNGRMLGVREVILLKDNDELRIHARNDATAANDVVIKCVVKVPVSTDIWEDNESTSMLVVKSQGNNVAAINAAPQGVPIQSQPGAPVQPVQSSVPAQSMQPGAPAQPAHPVQSANVFRPVMDNNRPAQVPVNQPNVPDNQGVVDLFQSAVNANVPANNIDQNAKAYLHINIRERSVKHLGKVKRLLKDINISIPTNNMVLILGGSGAGKTTFMNAVMGYEPADGKIVFDNKDLYSDFEELKFDIGYVPQKDLVRDSDKVYETLLNASYMRLPAGLPSNYYVGRTMETLKLLNLENEKDSIVRTLSGGQKKRLNIGVEYVGSPSLFFLDEPDSGLGSDDASSLMEQLSTISKQDKIVMVITHAPDRAVDLFDKVIVLAKDSVENCGQLAFYGSPVEAKQFFEVDTLEKIVRAINQPGMSDHYINKFKECRR